MSYEFFVFFFFFSSRRRHTRWNCDWSSDVCSSDLGTANHPAGDRKAGTPAGESRPPRPGADAEACRRAGAAESRIGRAHGPLAEGEGDHQRGQRTEAAAGGEEGGGEKERAGREPG